MLPATAVNVLVDTSSLARPERALVVVNLVRAAGAAVIAVAAVVDQPLLLFGALAVASAAGALVRPTTLALLPAVAVRPEDLVSANTAGALGESLGTFLGPLLAGIVVARSGAAPAAALAAAAGVIAAIIVLRVTVAAAARPVPAERARGLPLLAGIRELVRRRPAGVVMLSFGVQVTVRGALTTFLAILAIEVLDMGDAGVGLLGAAIGAGGIVGAVVAVGFGAGGRLAGMFAAALVAWGAAAHPHRRGAEPGRRARGPRDRRDRQRAARRLRPDAAPARHVERRARRRVRRARGPRQPRDLRRRPPRRRCWSRSSASRRPSSSRACSCPITAVAGWPWVRRLDREGVVPERQARLLRGIPLFAPLPLAALERVASGMEEVRFEPGEPLMTQGEEGDTYLVLETGRVLVTIDGRPSHEQGPGDGIGEIALLHAVPRTATVTALEPVDAFSIDCTTFVDAVTGHEASRSAAREVVDRRLGAGGAKA